MYSPLNNLELTRRNGVYRNKSLSDFLRHRHYPLPTSASGTSLATELCVLPGGPGWCALAHSRHLASVREEPRLPSTCSSCLSLALVLAGPQTHNEWFLKTSYPLFPLREFAFRVFRVGLRMFQAWAGRLSWLARRGQEGALCRGR